MKKKLYSEMQWDMELLMQLIRISSEQYAHFINIASC